MKRSFLTLAIAALIIACNNEKASESTDTTKKDTSTNSQAMNNTTTPADPAQPKDIVITRVFDAPVAAVWKAWTDPKTVMKWWGPTSYTCPSAKIDLREGGAYVWAMRAPKEQGGGDMYTSGIYTQIVPMQKLAFTNGLSDKDGKRIDPATMGMPADFPKDIPTTIVFTPKGDKTELTVTESGWKTGPMRDMSEAGMNECLDKLAKTLK